MKVFVAFILAFLIGTYCIPIIINISKMKKIYDEPDERKLNSTVVPTLGGAAIFLAMILSTLIGLYKESFESFHFILGGMTIIFFTGMKDDLINIAPMKKLGLQIIAAVMIIVLADIRFTSLHGFMGIYEINYIGSMAVTVLTFIVITNGINLIDGIDGLAASIAIVGGTIFGIWFITAGLTGYGILSFATVGSYTAFFVFNVFGKQNKIFMGDTGSLLLGYVLSIFVVKFNQANIAPLSELLPNTISNPIAVSLAILVIPIFDTVRVFLIRASQRKSPFLPDKNHIHHLMLKLVDSHLTATLLLSSANIVIAVSAFVLTEKMGFYSGILFVLLLGGLMVSLPEIVLNVKETREGAQNENKENQVRKVRFKIIENPKQSTTKFTNVN